MAKPIYKIPIPNLDYGNGVSLAQAKKAFLSGMSSGFKKKVKVVFVKDHKYDNPNMALSKGYMPKLKTITTTTV